MRGYELPAPPSAMFRSRKSSAKWKRALFFFHRWAGILLCVLFALWYLSGVVMMYMPFPELTALERREGLPALDFSSARLTPAQIVSRLHRDDFCIAGHPDGNTVLAACAGARQARPMASDIQIGMLLGRPVYRIGVRGGAQPRTIYADTGELLQQVTPQMARAVAVDFALRAGWITNPAAVAYDGQIQTDQWTVSGEMNAYRPLFRFSLNDKKGTELYVSSTTAQVVRDTRRRERIANYFGAVTHWIYPTFLRRHLDMWTWIIDITSGLGTLVAISGLWAGILRWRWVRPPGVSAIPYRRWMRWHFITGALFGVLTLTWVFSGLLSMNPGGLDPSRRPTPAETRVLSGKGFTASDFQVIPAVKPLDGVVEATLLHYAGQPFYRFLYRDGTMKLVSAARDTNTVHWPTIAALLARAPAIEPEVPLSQLTVLRHYDDYYYTRDGIDGGKPLPAIRAKFADAAHTWFYIDVTTGQIVARCTRINRVYRWLYNGLHSWDFPWLWNRRPLWDIVVIGMSLCGLCLSVLGVIVGIRRLQFDLAKLAERGHRLEPR